MPRMPRRRYALTDDWQQLQLLIQWPEQLLYELIRPVVLFGMSAAERARQTTSPERSVRRKADRFDRHGMVSLFADFTEPKQTDRRTLPPPLRQLIVDLKTEYPAFRLGEIAQICYVKFDRRLSPHTIQKILWIEEGVPGLEDKPPIPKHPKRKVNVRVANEVRKLQENPEL